MAEESRRVNMHAETLNANAKEIGALSGKVDIILAQTKNIEERQIALNDSLAAKIEKLGKDLAIFIKGSEEKERRMDERIGALESTAAKHGERITALEQAPAKKLASAKDDIIKQVVTYAVAMLLGWLAFQLGVK
ncbi:MAG: hypothetical protein FWG10_14600 [Eubacteriaceae bacterium]|nr:hypothetical protein [Eubacteriaceae bacterium]